MSFTEHAHVLTGVRLYLREVRLSDIDGEYGQWMNDPDVVRYTEARFTPNCREQLGDYVSRMNGRPDCIFRAIILLENDRHIGNIKLGPIDWNHRFGDIGIIIGAKDCWGKNYAAESIRLLADYAFSFLKLHKLTAGCYAGNDAALKAFEKSGFSREGVRGNQYLSDGQYVDYICLGAINPAERPPNRVC